MRKATNSVHHISMHCDALKQTSVNLQNTQNALEENEN